MNSKNIFKLFVILFLSAIVTSFNYQTSKDITGIWLFNDSPREIEIYTESNKYFGKIVKPSGENDKEKVGFIILKDFVYDSSDGSYSGEINSPDGMTASAKLVLLNENKLKFSVKKLLISKTFTLNRIK